MEASGQGAVIRSGPVTVRLTSSSPIEVMPAEWYPDIHVALPTSRLCLLMPTSPRRIEFRLAADRDHLQIVS